MEINDNEHAYVPFAIDGVHDAIQQNVISHEEICEPDCILPNVITEVTIERSATEQSDEDEERPGIYPIYIKQEEQHQYTSGDDESLAVEALRQLGGMYPCFGDKKISCPNCGNLFSQAELDQHNQTCLSVKLSCTTCGEKFERKQDLNNHMVCHQVDRPHACRTCGNLFRSKANLQTHMSQVHQTEKPHKCTICGADFQRPSSLSNHMKIHTYIAGRALMTSQANTNSQWRDNEPQNSSIACSSIQAVTNYDVSQVQWSVPPYNFTNDQAGIVASGHEKMDTLQEFTVMPNGEVTQFEYDQQSSLSNPISQPYGLTVNSYDNIVDTVAKDDSPALSPEAPKNHVEIEINGSVYKPHTCVHCGASFSRATALASHEKIHGVKTWIVCVPIECEFCDKQFQDSNHLATHQTTCAKKLMQSNTEQGGSNSKWGKHPCTECGKKFTTKQKMFRHQWIHRKKTHSCEICGSQFEKQNQLDEHRLSAHPGDSPFTCSECGKSFVSRQGLWEHGRTHAGSPAHFHCDTCSKTFSSRQGYLIHHRTHTGERPYGCKFCWKAFRDGGTLRKHERIHTGERPHVCPLCSRAFNQKVVLREHVRWVHAAGKNDAEATGPPYPCPLCSALNQDRDELCAHIVKHSDQMIAEAKAKTNNNAPKPKPSKKRTKTAGNSRAKNIASRTVSRTEQNEALLSIAVEETEDNVESKAEVDATLLLVSGDNDEVSEIESDNMQVISDVETRDNSKSLVLTGEQQDAIITKIRNSDINVLHLIQNSKKNETLRLIAAVKSNNTLHLVTEQNESLPVLTLSNPQSDVNFSSQINERQVSIGIVEETTSDDRVAKYLQEQRKDSDDDGEMVCGICGDDFEDKNILMEHVKIHI